MTSSQPTSPPDRPALAHRGALALASFLALATMSPGLLPASDIRTYTGCCDASAAALVNETLFAIGSDEDNILRVYRREVAGAPVRTLDVSRFLGLRPKDELDLEGAARLGDLIFWIGSHSRNPEGKPRPSRHLLFATAIQGEGIQATLAPTGRPLRTLVTALAADPKYATFGIIAAASRPPEAPGGWNIEALAAGPDGSLLIGLRNPVPEGRALVIPLLNPGEVIDQRAPRFGPPLRPNLGGLGIRGMTAAGDGHLLVGGPAEGGGRHRLFRWEGGSQEPRELPGIVPRRFQAESVLFEAHPGGGGTADLLSDDGKTRMEGQRCQDLRDMNQRRFQALRVAL